MSLIVVSTDVLFKEVVQILVGACYLKESQLCCGLFGVWSKLDIATFQSDW